MSSGRLRGITSLTVLQEVIYLLARWAQQRREPGLREAGRQIVRSTMSLVDETLVPTAWEFSRALDAYGPGKDINDLLIVEAMRTRGIETIISADRGFDALNARRRDPGGWI